MLSKVLSMGLLGIDGYPVTVEVDISFVIPMFEIVGDDSMLKGTQLNYGLFLGTGG